MQVAGLLQRRGRARSSQSGDNPTSAHNSVRVLWPPLPRLSSSATVQLPESGPAQTSPLASHLVPPFSLLFAAPKKDKEDEDEGEEEEAGDAMEGAGNAAVEMRTSVGVMKSFGTVSALSIEWPSPFGVGEKSNFATPRFC